MKNWLSFGLMFYKLCGFTYANASKTFHKLPILFYLCKCIENVKNGKDKLEEYFLFQNSNSNFML